MKYHTATPYIATYALLRDGLKVAFVRRSNTGWMDGYYGLPAGKVEINEPIKEAVIREAREEVGVTIETEALTHALTMQRFADDMWIDVFFNVSSWDGEVINAEPHMHSEVAWLDVTALPDTVIPSLRFAFASIAEGQTYVEYRGNS